MTTLKAEGITVLQLDHTGKDADKGQRGASAKRDNADVVWILEEIEKDHLFRLACDKDRDGDFGGIGATRYLVREEIPVEGVPLRHRFATDPEVTGSVFRAAAAEEEYNRQRVLALLDKAGGELPKSEVLKHLGGENKRSRDIVQALVLGDHIKETTGSHGKKFLGRTGRTTPDAGRTCPS
jgi:hypothetical protein